MTALENQSERCEELGFELRQEWRGVAGVEYWLRVYKDGDPLSPYYASPVNIECWLDGFTARGKGES